MTEKKAYIVGKVVLPESGPAMIQPIGRRCAVSDCLLPAVGPFAWPDEHTRVYLCQQHARVLMARADFLEKVKEDG